MSGANAALALPPSDRDDAPELQLDATPAPVAQAARVLPPGIELLLETLHGALADGIAAFTALQDAKSKGDMAAIREAAANLVLKLKSDPLALARRVNFMVER